MINSKPKPQRRVVLEAAIWSNTIHSLKMLTACQNDKVSTRFLSFLLHLLGCQCTPTIQMMKMELFAELVWLHDPHYGVLGGCIFCQYCEKTPPSRSSICTDVKKTDIKAAEKTVILMQEVWKMVLVYGGPRHMPVKQEFFNPST